LREIKKNSYIVLPQLHNYINSTYCGSPAPVKLVLDQIIKCTELLIALEKQTKINTFDAACNNCTIVWFMHMIRMTF